jgi:DNA-binding transcriptional ArsR family regulator
MEQPVFGETDPVVRGHTTAFAASRLGRAGLQSRFRAAMIVGDIGALEHGTRPRNMLTIRDRATFDQAVEALKFLADGNRLRILAALAEEETCVCDLIDDLELSQTLVSYHLGKLRKAGLVRARRDAQWMYYSLDADAWQRLIAPLSGLLLPAPLPSSASFGASHRCDVLPPDPARGACGCDALDCDHHAEVAPDADGTDGAPLSPAALDRITGEVLARLLDRLPERPPSRPRSRR